MNIEIILLKEELIHHIEADIQRIERTRKLQDTPILLGDEADRYKLCSLIDEALNEAIKPMLPYLTLPSSFAHGISVNHTDNWKERSIQLAMPPNWPPYLLDHLRNAVSKYIERRAEYQLLAVAMPDDPFTVMCESFANRHYNEINSAVSDRRGPIKVHPTSFG